MAYELVRSAVRPVVQALYRLEVRGLDQVPADGPLIVAANHASVLDPLVLGCALPRPLRFLAKEELWSHPVVGWALDALGGIPVARGRGDVAALAAARSALGRGEAVGLFPEGGVRRHGPWLRGAARLALVTGAPLLPVRLLGTAAAISRGRVGLPRVAVLVGAPLAVASGRPTVAAARGLTAQLQAAVESLGT